MKTEIELNRSSHIFSLMSGLDCVIPMGSGQLKLEMTTLMNYEARSVISHIDFIPFL